MWLNGLMLLMVIAIAKCSEAELTVEAAFQGRCGHSSPCEQLCYELHDGMYECDCSEGYELNKNGYSCQEINSTLQPGADLSSKTEEDVLYQKGASFSAKLETDVNGNDLDDSNSSNSNDDDDDDDLDIQDSLDDNLNNHVDTNVDDSKDSNKSGEEDSGSDSRELYPDTDDLAKSIKCPLDDKSNSKNLKNGKIQQNNQRNAFISTATTTDQAVTSGTSSEVNQYYITDDDDDDNYYAKQDMSIYDDVNNNRLNLRPYSVQTTYQNTARSKIQLDTRHSDNLYSNNNNNNNNNYNYNKNNDNSSVSNNNNSHINNSSHSSNNNNNCSVSSSEYNTRSESSVSGKSGRNDSTKGQSGAASNSEADHSVQMEPCLLDCGSEGICEYAEDVRSKRCLCPFGKTGLGCTEDMKISIPRFTKKSWLAFPALRGAYKHVQLRVEFRPESHDGIILLTGERDDLTGDFMALLIHQGYIEFWFDCGSGTGSVRSKEQVLLNQWNSITIYRHRWDAWLVLNHGEREQGRSQGLFSRITFREPVFLGGTGNITGLAKRLPVYEGMVGCIRRFIANEHEYKFSEHPFGDVTKGFAIEDCTTDKCTRYPCRHGGKCLPSDQGAVCLCPLGFGGDLCEMRLDLQQIPSFNGSSYLRYAPLGDSALIWLELQIIIKAEQEDGVILYSGHEEYGDYIALSLNMGFVEFAFDLGSGPALVRSEFPLSMGQWHTIKVSRTARLAVLKIDQHSEVMTISSNGFWHLSLPHSLYLGGTHADQSLPLGLKERGSFVGCIQKVEINGRSISIISEALGGTNVDNCPHACADKPCGPLAQCVPLLDNYECRCNPFNAQCNKAEEVPLKQIVHDKTKETKSRTNQQEQDKPQMLPNNEPKPKHSNHSPMRPEANSPIDGSVHTTAPPPAQSQHVYPPDPPAVNHQQNSNSESILVDTDYEMDDNDNGKDSSDEDDNFGYVDYTYDIKPIQADTTFHTKDISVPSRTYKKINLKDDNVVHHTEELSEKAATISDSVNMDRDKQQSYVVDRYMSVDTERLLEHEKDVMMRQRASKEKFFREKSPQSSELDSSSESLTSSPLLLSSSSSSSGLSSAPSASLISGIRRRVPILSSSQIKNKASKRLVHKSRKHLRVDDTINPDYNKNNHNDNDNYEYNDDSIGHIVLSFEPNQSSTKSSIDDDDDADEDEDKDSMVRTTKSKIPSKTGRTGSKKRKYSHHRSHKTNANQDIQGDGKYSDTFFNGAKNIPEDLKDLQDEDNNNNKDNHNRKNNEDTNSIPRIHTPSSSSSLTDYMNGASDFQTRELIQDMERIMKNSNDIRAKDNYGMSAFRRSHGACFTGTDSYFHYNDAETMSQIISYRIDLNLRFKTHSNYGVILWSGRQSALDSDDFLSLGIENGYLHLRYNLGSGEINIEFNSTRVSDGLWHRVRAIRNLQEGSLEVDGRKSVVQRSPGKLRQLNTDTGLFVGGMPDVQYYTRRRYFTGIVGCISEIVLAGEVRLNLDPATLGTAHNVEVGIL